MPDIARPIFDVFANLLDAGWAPKDAIETVRTERPGTQTPGLRTMEHRKKLPEGDPPEEPQHAFADHTNRKSPMQKINMDAEVEPGSEAQNHPQGGAGEDDLSFGDAKQTDDEPENDRYDPSIFKLNRLQAEQDLNPETLPCDTKPKGWLSK